MPYPIKITLECSKFTRSNGSWWDTLCRASIWYSQPHSGCHPIPAIFAWCQMVQTIPGGQYVTLGSLVSLLQFIWHRSLIVLCSLELEVFFCKHNVFLNPDHSGPPQLISVDSVLSHVSRVMVKINETHPDGYTDSDAEDTDSETPLQHELVWVLIGTTTTEPSC